MPRELSGDTVVEQKTDEPVTEDGFTQDEGLAMEGRAAFSSLACGLLIATIFFTFYQLAIHGRLRTPSTPASVSRCTVRNLHSDLSFLQHARPIGTQEFLRRRDRLARALDRDGVDAFVFEPGYTSEYYLNISQRDWEPWEPEERPFVTVIRPQKNGTTVAAKTTFLVPAFEVGRARMLGIPSHGELDVIPWEEHEDPYAILRESLGFNSSTTVMVDEEMRDYISRGIREAGVTTVGLSSAVEGVRQIKSAAEVELLRAVNTGTVQGIRALQKCLKTGIREREVVTILDDAMKTIGFKEFFNIVLFDENAALPHGGFATGDKALHPDTMILIDVGYHYQGYSSDVCRSFFMPRPSAWYQRMIPDSWSDYLRGYSAYDRHRAAVLEEKKHVWDVVFQAQTAAGHAFKPNGSCASVDLAAREVIDEAGYKGTFTHRVGHAHESPYLNKANTGTLLMPGMTFTNEPGVYLEGKFGVRHEDIYLVTEHGEAEVLSGKRATSPYEP